jgi:hypothetical protein
MSLVFIVRPMCAVVSSTTRSAVTRSSLVASHAGTSAITSAPSSVAISTRKTWRPVQKLGQRQIEASLRLWSGIHRDTKARSARLAAVHGDDERLLSPRPIYRIDELSHENLVLDRDGMQLA